MDKSYATPDLAKMAMYWGFDRPCSAGVTVKAPVLYAERETLDSVPEGVIPIPTLEQIQRWLREEKKVNVYCAPILVDPEWIWMACIDDEAVTDSTHTIRNDRGVLKVPDCVNTQLFKEYYDALYHGIASQFGIWRSEKQ
jgi:hypothetical protein